MVRLFDILSGGYRVVRLSAAGAPPPPSRKDGAETTVRRWKDAAILSLGEAETGPGLGLGWGCGAGWKGVDCG
jgi:hypothetical protein